MRLNNYAKTVPANRKYGTQALLYVTAFSRGEKKTLQKFEESKILLTKKLPVYFVIRSTVLDFEH